MAIRTRDVREDEVGAALDLFVESLRDLVTRSGADPSTIHREEWADLYPHVFRTGIFRVAEEEGRIVAICNAIVRERTWFLSGFWARPGRQRAGVGGPLLREVWSEGQRRGANVFFTWASPDPTALAAYMRRGMLPGAPILQFAGEPTPEDVHGIELVELSLDAATAIDREILGYTRDIDQRYWAGESGRVSRVALRDGKPIGYYSTLRGTIGPAAWLDPGDAFALLDLAARDALTQSPRVRGRPVGINHDAVRWCLARGLRLFAHSTWLTTSAFGRLDRYVPSGPTLF